MTDFFYILQNFSVFYILSFLLKIGNETTGRYFRLLLGYVLFSLIGIILYRIGLNLNIVSLALIIISIIILINKFSIIKEDLLGFKSYEVIGLLLIVYLGCFGSETYKVFPGKIYDRSTYIVTSYIVKSYDYTQIISYLNNLFSIGVQTPLQMDYLFSRGAGEILNRPGASITYALSTFFFGNEFYRLANSFENICKILFITTLYGSVITKDLNVYKRVIALILIQSMYWVQYSKDINSWSMLSVMPVLFFLVNEFIFNKNNLNTRIINTTILLVFCFVYYPEGTLALGLPIGIYYLLAHYQSPEFTKNLKVLLVIGIVSISIALFINPGFIDFILRQGNFSGGYSPVDAAHYIRDLVCRNCQNFDQVSSFVSNLSVRPIVWGGFGTIVLEVVNYLLVVFGFIGAFKVFGVFSIIVLGGLFYFLVTNRDRLLLLIAILLSIQLIYLGLNKLLPWVRSVNYTSLFISSIFIYLLFKYQTKISKFLILILLILSIFFQLNIIYNIYNETNKFNRFFSYTWLQDPIFRPEYDGKNMEYFDFSSSEISGVINKCNYVFISIDDVWLRTYFEILLSSKGINYYKHENLTGMWDGDITLNRAPFRPFDCMLTEFESKGKRRVDLILLNENQSLLRGKLK